MARRFGLGNRYFALPTNRTYTLMWKYSLRLSLCGCVVPCKMPGWYVNVSAGGWFDNSGVGWWTPNGCPKCNKRVSGVVVCVGDPIVGELWVEPLATEEGHHDGSPRTRTRWSADIAQQWNKAEVIPKR